jgi:hypothetical protein
LPCSLQRKLETQIERVIQILVRDPHPPSPPSKHRNAMLAPQLCRLSIRSIIRKKKKKTIIKRFSKIRGETL